MNLVFRNPRPATITDQIQSRLLGLAAVFLFLYSLALSLSAAVRLHSWNAALRWEHWLGFAIWLGVFLACNRASQVLTPERDPFILPIAALLSGWGVLTIWRLDTLLGLRQTIWLAVSGIVLILGLRLTNLPGIMQRYKYLWLAGGLLLTSLTFLFGTYPSGVGPRLWLGCCGLYFQPSEPLKLLLIVYLSAYLADQILVRFSFTSLVLPTIALTGIAAVLLVAQRDLGTATLFLLLYASVIYVATGRKRFAVGSLLVAGITALAGYLAFDVVRLRVDTWLDPWKDASGRAYQVIQSLIAIATGGVFGRGPGLGNPGIVPVSQSDFIFSAIAEEMGLAGTIGLILLIGILVVRGFRISFRAVDPYQRFLAAGLSTYLALQSILIIGGNLRLLPLTGVTLPFVSYGGSSLLTSFIALLLFLLISNHPDQEPTWLPHPSPYLNLAAVLLVALGIAAMLNGWWALFRGDDLQSRFDNPRLAIDDRYVRRGSLLDRNYAEIASTTGEPGSYTRNLEDAALSPVVGYAHPRYGRTGLEASMDPYLRGVQGNPASLLAWDKLAYGQPPPGLNVRTSLDLNLQRLADNAMQGYNGSLALVNARTGEILAMTSHPGFDANQLDKTWPDLVNSPESPLVNRASQGQYPPGTAIGPFLLSEALAGVNLPTMPKTTSVLTGKGVVDCSLPLSGQPTWGSAISAGCPGSLVEIGRSLGTQRMTSLFTRLGLFSSPKFELAAGNPTSPPAVGDVQEYALGREGLAVSPLQMALATAGLTNNGLRPAPRMVISVQTPDKDWVILPSKDKPVQEFQTGNASRALDVLAVNGQPSWSSVGEAPNGEGKTVSWYTGGTLPTWKGTPVAIAVALENADPSAAQRIGSSLIEAAMH